MITEIYYLSGTGNSLYTAKELEKRIPDSKLIPILNFKNEENIKTNSETVGFIFPIHFMTAPKIVMDTIKRLNFDSAKYIFIIATRYGTPCSLMMKKIDKILKSKGKCLNSHLVLNMANNDSKFKNWHQYTKKKLKKFEKKMKKRLDLYHKVIINKENYQEKDTQITFPVNPVMEHLGSFMINATGDGREAFYADSKCNGCGACEKVCLSQKIHMVDGKPEWQKKENCFSCYACINYCPVQAIQIQGSRIMKFYTEENGR